MSKDVRMLNFFLDISIINKTWMNYQKCCSILYSSVEHLSHTKSYLWDGWKTKDVDRYLVVKILSSPTYGVERRPRIPMGTWS